MSKITECVDAVCNLVAEKVKVGFGISSPQAASLEEKLAEFENELVALNIFPSDWTHKHSIGKGNLASVMWVVFLPPEQTTQDGIYVSFCFGKAGNGLVTGCAISNTSQKKYSYIPTVKRPDPKIDVDGTRQGTHYNNGYVNPLEMFAGEVDEGVLLNHIHESVKKCKECLRLEVPDGKMSDEAKRRHVIWDQFLAKWPADKIAEMSLTEYTSYGGEHDSFCNWLESRTGEVGSIWGGSAYKFGVFERAPSKKPIDDSTHGSDSRYGWYKCYGDSAAEVFSYVRTTFLRIIEAVRAGDLDAIDKIEYGHAVKWKVAFMYQAKEKPLLVPIYNKRMLCRLSGMGVDTSTAIMQKRLMDEKPAGQDIFDYYLDLLKRMPVYAEAEAAEEDDMERKLKGKKKLSEIRDQLLLRLIAALRTKPFAILAGHSGTGKSQLVRRLAYMTCNNELLAKEGEGKTAPGNYCMVQVKPNWHDSTDLLGYYSEMGGRHFVTTPFVEFICKAYAYPDTPFFVCLDEMNLAPVEQYFAEYLSAIESMEKKGDDWLTDPLVEVYKTGEKDADGKEKVNREIVDQIMKGAASTKAAEWIQAHGLTIPKNLFVVGTVNMDETTCQFSRKVLDRAMTLLMNEVKFGDMAQAKKPSEEELLDGDGLKYFLDGSERGVVGETESKLLDGINEPLANTAFVVAYRFANEYALYEAAWAKLTDVDWAAIEPAKKEELAAKALDHVVLMKLLPRIHGERRVVEGIFNGRKVKGPDGDKDLPGLKAKVPGGLSAKMMDAILARPDEYLTFWP